MNKKYDTTTPVTVAQAFDPKKSARFTAICEDYRSKGNTLLWQWFWAYGPVNVVFFSAINKL